ncbi:unnamed protein product [Rotaria sp. Silwood2]|nr:unnamed protein product [Rotaria sp. Silwood2]
MQQQQRLAHILEIVQDLIALSILLAAESITFILDLTSLIQNTNIRTLINDPIYNLVRIKQPLELINDTIEFTFNNLSFSNLCPKTQELKDLLNNDEQLWKLIVQYLTIKISNIKSLIIEVRCKQLEFQLNKLLVHHILINKDYFDKIEKQLSNSDSQVSSIPSVIQLSQPSSSIVITISEP